MNILIINPHLAHIGVEGGKGGEAVMIATVNILRQSFPEAKFITTSYCTETLAKELRCEVIPNKIFVVKIYSIFDSLKSTIDLLRCTLWNMIHKHLKINLKILVSSRKLKEFSNADIIIHLGMDLYSDDADAGIITVIEQSKDILLGVMLRKPVVIWAESMGPFNSKLTRWLARITLNRASLITVREKITSKLLQELGIDKLPIHITADPAFLLDPASGDRMEQIFKEEGIALYNTGPFIGMSLSLTYLAGREKGGFGLAKSAYQMLQYVLPEGLFKAIVRIVKKSRFYAVAAARLDNYTTLYAQVIDYLVEKLNATVILIPHVQAVGALMSEKDIHVEALQKTKHRDRVKLLEHDYNTREIKGSIGRCDLFIGGRMHANIAALSQCIPTVALSYGHKFKGIMEMLGQEQYICSEVTYENIVSKVNDVWNKRVEIKDKISSKVEGIKELAALNGKLVKQMIFSKK